MTIKNACACDTCRAMCKRPCWGTPADIQKIIDAGHGNRLMLDYWVGDHYSGKGDIYILSPATKDDESGTASFWPHSEDGCTFWNKDGLCDLHDKGLKPTEGKEAHHSVKSEGLHRKVAMSWNNPQAEALVERWKQENWNE